MLSSKIRFATPLEKAVFAVGGKQKTLAEKLGISAQAITQTKKRGGNLPKSWMKHVIQITGLSKEDLYPEIFSHPQDASDHA